MFSHDTWLIYGTACQTMLWMQKAIRQNNNHRMKIGQQMSLPENYHCSQQIRNQVSWTLILNLYRCSYFCCATTLV